MQEGTLAALACRGLGPAGRNRRCYVGFRGFATSLPRGANLIIPKSQASSIIYALSRIFRSKPGKKSAHRC